MLCHFGTSSLWKLLLLYFKNEIGTATVLFRQCASAFARGTAPGPVWLRFGAVEVMLRYQSQTSPYKSVLAQKLALGMRVLFYFKDGGLIRLSPPCPPKGRSKFISCLPCGYEIPYLDLRLFSYYFSTYTIWKIRTIYFKITPVLYQKNVCWNCTIALKKYLSVLDDQVPGY